MTESDFILSKFDLTKVSSGSVTWKTPSNIALVKYWGKREPQIPENASISFTLDACFTITTLEYKLKKSPITERNRSESSIDLISNPFNQQSNNFDFEIYFEDEKKDDFKPKIQKFFERIEQYVPFLNYFDFVIKSRNSFPHSSGIASSASGMSALALCVMSLERLLNGVEISDEYFNKKASFLARLGSGSACRSIEGELIIWGNHSKISGSSDLFGIKFPYKIHKNFYNYHDTILLIDEGEKQVSSTIGHNLMHNHPFADQRFKQANDSISKISEVLQNGNLTAFIKIVESEALSLHAMMLTSDPYFILMKPNTLKIVNKIWEFRKLTNSKVCFTLDAGANVHVLFPEAEKDLVNNFIINELIKFCQKNHYICDRIGKGAKQLKIEN